MEDGLQTIDHIFDVFAVARGVKLEYFDPDGRELLIPHPDNIRGHLQVIHKYAVGVLKFGVIPSVRGEQWCQASAPSHGITPTKMISNASLSRAVYLAKQMDPKNPNLLRTLRNGLPNVWFLVGGAA